MGGGVGLDRNAVAPLSVIGDLPCRSRSVVRLQQQWIVLGSTGRCTELRYYLVHVPVDRSGVLESLA
eukprot:COSAG01_NODE_47219_length_392_cov_1.638225_1_plen_67_part_00